MQENKFISLAEYCRKLGITAGRGRQIVSRIPGAQKIGGAWIIPADAADPRKPVGKPKKEDKVIDMTKESAARTIAEASDFIDKRKEDQ